MRTAHGKFHHILVSFLHLSSLINHYIRCISSEVYGNTAAGVPNQWVGDLTTADVNYENGIFLNYTLIDKESYLWLQ
jgi:hypothetical protein